jgi:hypothetical protein
MFETILKMKRNLKMEKGSFGLKLLAGLLGGLKTRWVTSWWLKLVAGAVWPRRRRSEPLLTKGMNGAERRKRMRGIGAPR